MKKDCHEVQKASNEVFKMSKIDIETALFHTLKSDYEEFKEKEQYLSQFQAGLDYMEAIIKLFGVVSISILKEIDYEKYKKVFNKNFKTSTSLGGFKSLGTRSFPKSKKNKVTTDKKIYIKMSSFLHENREINIDSLNKIDILDIKKQGSYWEFIENVAVNFRNKFKGHSASFKDNEVENAKVFTTALDVIIKVLEDVLKFIINTLEFYNNDMILQIRYEDEEYSLLPIIMYINCNSYSCSNKSDAQKIFFFNDGSITKSFYLDYGYNHFFVSNDNDDLFSEMQNVKEQHSTSNANRKNNLLQNFVGREKYLETLNNSILGEKTTFTYITGKPGIGKSALITKFTQNISEVDKLKEKIKTFIYYVEEGQTGDDEALEFYIKLKNEIGIYIEEKTEDTAKNKLENLFKLYQDSTKKHLLLIVDGLDEFKNPTDFLSSFPLSQISKNINIVFTSRVNKSINNHISTITSNINHIDCNSFELETLSYDEAYTLVDMVLPKKDLDDDSKKEIINIIIQRSEKLPIYIDFITKELKEFNSVKDTKKELLEKANELPGKLQVFFEQKFESISSLSRDILRLFYFSRTAIDIDELYYILKNSSKYIDNKDAKEFLNDFNNIEIFLKTDDKNRYTFYHLSVKEAVLNSFDGLVRFDKEKLDGLVYTNDIEDNESIIDDFYYLSKDSNAYELLANTIRYLKSKKNSNKYKNKNFLHLFNRLIYINLLHKAITYDDIKDKNYKSLEHHKPTKNDEIKEFFELVNKKKDNNEIERYEIRYAYELALFVEDYDEVLKFYDMYNEYILDVFLDICTNINEDGNIQKFIELKNEWKNSLSDEYRDFFVEVLDKHEKIDDSFYDVLVFIKDEYKARLYCKVLNYIAVLQLIDFGYCSDADFYVYRTLNIENIEKTLNVMKYVSYYMQVKIILEILYKLKEKHFDQVLNIIRKYVLSNKVFGPFSEEEHQYACSRILSFIVNNKNTSKVHLELIIEILQFFNEKYLNLLLPKMLILLQKQKSINIFNIINLVNTKTNNLDLIFAIIDTLVYRNDIKEIKYYITILLEKELNNLIILREITSTLKPISNELTFLLTAKEIFFVFKIYLNTKYLKYIKQHLSQYLEINTIDILNENIMTLNIIPSILLNYQNKLDFSENFMNPLLDKHYEINESDLESKIFKEIDKISIFGTSYEKYEVLLKILKLTSNKTIVNNIFTIIDEAPNFDQGFMGDVLIDILDTTDKYIEYMKNIDLNKFGESTKDKLLSKIKFINNIPNYWTEWHSTMVHIQQPKHTLELDVKKLQKKQRDEILFSISKNYNKASEVNKIISTIDTEEIDKSNTLYRLIHNQNLNNKNEIGELFILLKSLASIKERWGSSLAIWKKININNIYWILEEVKKIEQDCEKLLFLLTMIEYVSNQDLLQIIKKKATIYIDNYDYCDFEEFEDSFDEYKRLDQLVNIVHEYKYLNDIDMQTNIDYFIKAGYTLSNSKYGKYVNLYYGKYLIQSIYNEHLNSYFFDENYIDLIEELLKYSEVDRKDSFFLIFIVFFLKQNNIHFTYKAINNIYLKQNRQVAISILLDYTIEKKEPMISFVKKNILSFIGETNELQSIILQKLSMQTNITDLLHLILNKMQEHYLQYESDYGKFSFLKILSNLSISDKPMYKIIKKEILILKEIELNEKSYLFFILSLQNNDTELLDKTINEINLSGNIKIFSDIYYSDKMLVKIYNLHTRFNDEISHQLINNLVFFKGNLELKKEIFLNQLNIISNYYIEEYFDIIDGSLYKDILIKYLQENKYHLSNIDKIIKKGNKEILNFILENDNTDKNIIYAIIENANCVEIIYLALDKLALLVKQKNELVLYTDIIQRLKNNFVNKDIIRKINNVINTSIESENKFNFHNLLVHKINIQFKINNTLRYISTKSPYDILKYYNIIEQEQLPLFEKYIVKLKDLKDKRDKAEAEENEEIFDNITKEVDIIKKEIKDNTELLEQFLEKLNIKKIKFSSFDILDNIDLIL